MSAESTSFSSFCSALFFLFIGVAATNFFSPGETAIGVRIAQPSFWGPSIIALLFGILAFLRPTDLVQRCKRVTTNPLIWLGLFIIMWNYFAYTSISAQIQRDRHAATVEESILPIQLALERWVVPRTLTKDQIESIGTYLAKFDPYRVIMTVSENDEETSSYSSDIRRALAKGGWDILEINYAPNVRAGISIDFNQTQATAQAKEDSRHHKPDHILSEAFRLAGVQLGGMSGSNGTNITQDILKIGVGPRRRDAYGERQRPINPDALTKIP